MEAPDSIECKIHAGGTFPGYFNLCLDKFIFVWDRIRWTIDTAWSVIEMQVVADLINVSCAFPFE